MMKRLATVLSLGLLLVPGVAFADNLSYDDPAIHFQAPDGWTRVDIQQPDGGQSQAAPVALFQKVIDKNDTRRIGLRIDQNDDNLDTIERATESDIRQQSDDVFFEKKQRFTMANGMPAWELIFTLGGITNSTGKIFEYVVSDGKRSIVLSYASRASTFDEKDAEAALKSLTVVLYPQNRP